MSDFYKTREELLNKIGVKLVELTGETQTLKEKANNDISIARFDGQMHGFALVRKFIKEIENENNLIQEILNSDEMKEQVKRLREKKNSE